MSNGRRFLLFDHVTFLPRGRERRMGGSGMVVEMESEGITSSVANESDALEIDCSFSSLVGRDG